MKNRNSLQITSIILDTVQSETDTTTIMRRSNLPHPRLKEILSTLIGNELINKIEYDGKNTFVITEKGRLYLSEYKRFVDFADSFGLYL